MKRDILLCIAIAVSAVASYAAYVAVPPIMGDLYRIVYLHVPLAWVCYLAFSISLIASIAYLAKRKHAYDRIAEVSAVLGLIYGVIALISGSIWANATWGTYWNWDPRETTTLILWIAYVGYLSLRRSIGGFEKRAAIGSVYNILAFSTIPLSYMSIMLSPLHPQIVTSTEILMTRPMLATLFLNLIAASLFFFYLLITAFTVRSLEDRISALIYERGGDENV